LIVNVTKIGAQSALVGALAFTALGIGSGIANAHPQAPSTPGITWKLDRPHHDDWDNHDDDWRDARWDGPRWDGPAYYGPCVWVPPAVSGWVPPAVC
jgi:hypothetical protein